MAMVIGEAMRSTSNAEVFHNVQSGLTPKGPKAIFKPFLKFGLAIVKAIFIKNS
jgi:hypothetical protein